MKPTRCWSVSRTDDRYRPNLRRGQATTGDNVLAGTKEQTALGALRSWGAVGTALFGLAIVLRLVTLQNQPFWVDEYDELTISSQDVGAIITTDDGFPPLGFLLTRAWLSFGSFASARYLALLYGLAAVVVIALVAHRVAGRKAALIALGLAGTSPFLIWYSQELRTYSLLMFLSGASLLALLTAIETGHRCCGAWLAVATPCPSLRSPQHRHRSPDRGGCCAAAARLASR